MEDLFSAFPRVPACLSLSLIPTFVLSPLSDHLIVDELRTHFLPSLHLVSCRTSTEWLLLPETLTTFFHCREGDVIHAEDNGMEKLGILNSDYRLYNLYIFFTSILLSFW